MLHKYDNWQWQVQFHKSMEEANVCNKEYEKDNFKESFKYYKSKWKIPFFDEVINFDKSQNLNVKELKLKTDIQNIPLGVKPIKNWKCYELNNSGLIFVQNPFTSTGQRYWIAKCLRDFPKSPNIVNLNPKVFEQVIIDDWWDSLQNCKDINLYKKIKTSMRWTTLGYHHDWNTKVYTELAKNNFPDDLAKLCGFFAKVLDFEEYSAEAAIVNYYPIGTTLAGHTDHSENDLEAPLFSFSFGQTAIFLIGGPTRDKKPDALFLKSGDIVIMSKTSRLCYHGVPRVMKTEKEVWNALQEEELFEYGDKNNIKPPKIMKIDESLTNISKNTFIMDEKLWNDCSNELFWKSFNDYLTDSRININVRQVLKKGQTKL